jgi:subtilisin family serine protease
MRLSSTFVTCPRVLVAFLSLATACTGDQALGPVTIAHAPSALRTPSIPAADRIPGEYVVVFRNDVSDVSGRARGLAAREKAQVRHTYSHVLRGFSVRMSSDAAARVASERDVAYVEPNALFHADGLTTETNAAWGLDRIDSHPLKLNNTYSYTSTGTGVTVYVLDTGIDLGNPEFEGRATWIGASYAPTTVYCPGSLDEDVEGHGTHVAGVIGSHTYGVAKGVALVSVPVLNCYNSGTLDGVLAGMDAVVAHHLTHAGPAVANMSLGSNAPFQSVFDAAAAMVNAGITLIVAAGNGSYQNGPFQTLDACSVSPAGAPAAITVGATDRTDHEAYFSNYGPCVDILAPGVDVVSVLSSHIFGQPAGTTLTLSGTSQATPHVAGAAARYLSLNPTATPEKVRTDLFGRATDGVITLNSGNTTTVNLLLYTDSKR